MNICSPCNRLMLKNVASEIRKPVYTISQIRSFRSSPVQTPRPVSFFHSTFTSSQALMMRFSSSSVQGALLAALHEPSGHYLLSIMIGGEGEIQTPVRPCRICNLLILHCQGCRRCRDCRAALLVFTRRRLTPRAIASKEPST